MQDFLMSDSRFQSCRLRIVLPSLLSSECEVSFAKLEARSDLDQSTY